jgi:hypothetical protein
VTRLFRLEYQGLATTDTTKAYATTNYKPKQVICLYTGEIVELKKLKNSDYAWKWTNNTAIDAAKTHCLAKYSNHYVAGPFPANAKLYNMTIWSKEDKAEYKTRTRKPKNAEYKVPKRIAVLAATKPIKAGQEIFWNYGASYWLKRNRIAPRDINEKNIMWRENKAENNRILSTLQARREREIQNEEIRANIAKEHVRELLRNRKRGKRRTNNNTTPNTTK